MGVQATDTQTVSAPEPVVASRGAATAQVSSAEVAELGPEASTWRARRARWRAAFCEVVCSPGNWTQRILCVLFWLAVIALNVTIFVILLPKALAQPIQSLITLISQKLTLAQLIAVVIGAVALAPCTLVIPMIPFVWIAGLALDFGTAFGIVMVGTFIGMSIQYWAARYVFKEKVEKHLLQRRKDGISVALRAVEIAGPWKVVALVRLGPSPYAAMNYIFGVCPTIKYHQYIIASMLCTAHRRALSVFFGRSMPTLAELFSGKPVRDVGAAVYRLVVLVLGIALVITIVILAKKALKKIQDEELERERLEAEAAAAAEAASAAEEGAAGEFDPEHKAQRRSEDSKQAPLPMAATDKLAGAAAGVAAGAAGTCGLLAFSSSADDLQVVVVDEASSSQDDATVTPQASTPSLSRTTSNSSTAPAVAPAPPAAADASAQESISSRWSSISSLQALFYGNNQRSS